MTSNKNQSNKFHPGDIISANTTKRSLYDKPEGWGWVRHTKPNEMMILLQEICHQDYIAAKVLTSTGIHFLSNANRKRCYRECTKIELQ
jgi:hypothetical protein